MMSPNLQEIVDELKRLQAKGLIRSYGVCNFGKENLEEIITAGAKMSTNQVCKHNLYNTPGS